jgi:hypothetical protein
MLIDKMVLTREYKESRRPMGVYQIRNTVNGKLFSVAFILETWMLAALSARRVMPGRALES